MLVLQVSRYIVTLVEKGALGRDGVLEAKDLEVQVEVKGDGSWVVRVGVDDEEEDEDADEDGEAEKEKVKKEIKKKTKFITKDRVAEAATTDQQATLAIWAETQNLGVKFNGEEIWRGEVSTEVEEGGEEEEE